MEKIKRILGIPAIKIRKTENYEKRYFLGVQYKIKKFSHRYETFLEAFEENVNTLSNKNIRVILNNLGEALIYARTEKYWYKKGMLVFGTKRQHADIFKMYAPEIPVFFCGEGPLTENINDKNNNHIEAILYNNKLIEMNNKRQPFLKSWEEYLGTNFSNLKYKKAFITEEDRKLALSKAKLLGVTLSKFVFLIPFARSMSLLPEQFWKNIEHELKEKGYDVIYNSKMFTIKEAYVLAEMSKGIISLRSGFNDVLSEIKTPQHIIYTNNRWHGDLEPMYSFNYFPWAEKDFIKEYNTSHKTIEKIENDIIYGF